MHQYHKELLCLLHTLTIKTFSPQQKLNTMNDESMFKSKQIEARIIEIHHLSEEIEVLSSSLQEKEAAAAQLQSELQTYQQVTCTPEQFLGLLKVTTQIAKLECKLQEAEEQKQRVELERGAIVQEMKAKDNLKAQLHAHFGKLQITSVISILAPYVPGFVQMNHPRSPSNPKA